MVLAYLISGARPGVACPGTVDALPIDDLTAEISRRALEAGALVLEAPPGAGKTTRVPWALLEALGTDGKVIVTEPRRLAARLAAERVARERGLRVGDLVGYAVRFEEVTGPKTRLSYVTEGILLRRLLVDPDLSGVRAVVLDEFHERHLETDLLLTLLARRREERRDLALIVMSATLDAGPVAQFLGDAPRVTSEGRSYPVTVEHLPRPDDRPLEKRVTSAVRACLDRESDGNVLVFLPGAFEIRKAGEALEALGRERRVLVLPLHGDLTVGEQARAVEPSRERKVVLSTNVAESSLTIAGVSSVVDSGLARMAAHSAWTGLSTLTTGKVSRASATQRAGRAGRTRDGHVLRLYTQGDFQARPEYDAPAVTRADLSEAVLMLAAAGVRAQEVRWLTPPPAHSLGAATSLLGELGALDPAGDLTSIGRRLLELPLHPRLGRLVVEGERRGVASDATLVAAAIGERDIRLASRADVGGRRPGRGDGASGPSDPLELADRFEEAEGARFEAHRVRAMGLDPRAVDAVERARKQLARLVRRNVPAPASAELHERALLACVLAGFPDRVAKRRRRGERDLVLANGKVARLSEDSVVHEAPLLVAIDAEERGGHGTVVRSASQVDENLLFELAPDRLVLADELTFTASAERVERVSSMRWGVLLLEETRAVATPGDEASRLLFEAARTDAARFLRSPAALTLAARVSLLGEHFPDAGFAPNPETALEQALEAACAGAVSFSELDQADLPSLFVASLSAEQRRLLEREAPEKVRLGSGRTVPVQYEAGKPPFIESRLQDFFGAPEGPRVVGGRVPLTLHLLAPNQRAVQVTTDLLGFWERHYPTIRRELMRRYPRHAWPEDGRTATPPPPKPPRERPR
jgi:ATP-dependent helicase HrpB